MANASPFKGKVVPAITQAELTARKSVRAYNDWFATRVPWVHIYSFCNQCQESVRILYSLKDANPYQNTTLRPKPVVESVQVKAQGNLGTTRQCTIKIIAFTQDQLDELAACYGVPSMSVRVQFGWNKSAGGDPAPGASANVLTDNQGVCQINKVAASNAAYDGLQGIVGKWSINFVKESLWWEFTLNIVAASSPVLVRPIQDMSSPCYCERQSTDSKSGEQTKKSAGTSAFRAKILDYINKVGGFGTVFATEGRIEDGVYSIHLNAPIRDELGGGSPGFWASLKNMTANVVGTAECNEAYISYKKLEDLVNKYSFSQMSSGNPLMAGFNSNSLGLLTYRSVLFSSDPHICLLPGKEVVVSDGLNGIKAADSCVQGAGINIQNILINCIFINKCLEELGENASLQDFFEKILTGITDACGGLWELSIVDDGKCDSGGGEMPTFSVVDLNKFEPVAQYILPVGPDSAVVRDIKLDLALTDAMLSQALYAGVRNNKNGKPADEDRYKQELKKSKNRTLPATTLPPKSDCGDCETKKEHEVKAPTIYNDYVALVSEITDSQKETVKTRLIEEHNKSPEKDISKNIIIPYEFSFTVDGIGGFAFGQLVTTNLLPKNVYDLYTYQVTAVEHSITHGDWTTTVNTKARRKS